MKELLDLQRFWAWCSVKWKTPAGAVAFTLLAFWFGMALKEKMITDDCKFMGTFRDGAYSYNCSARVR